jgi:hypothetical protein
MIVEMWELWIYRRWTHIPERRYASQYFWVRLSNIVGSKSFLKNFKGQLDTSLNKAQDKQELLCGKIFGSSRNVYVIEERFIQLRSISKSGFSKMSYPVFTPKPSTHHMHDPGSIVPHI